MRVEQKEMERSFGKGEWAEKAEGGGGQTQRAGEREGGREMVWYRKRWRDVLGEERDGGGRGGTQRRGVREREKDGGGEGGGAQKEL